MNICVGHLYRDKALTKNCTIVYAQKDGEYKLCIELKENGDGWKLIQKSAFNNTKPKGEVLNAFESWCRRKKINAQAVNQ